MIFSTSVFIFAFLPCALLGYYLVFRKTRRLQNAFLAIISLFFYAWGEPVWVILLIFSATQDYICGRVIGKARRKGSERLAKTAMIVSITTNLGLLGTFKYLDFFLENLGLLFHFSPALTGLALPIGISFYTFQTLSYTIDVYRGKVSVQRSYFDFLLFVSLFPSLVAGPIIRYETIAEQISNRRETLDDVCSGACRFIVGLAKKVVIANTLAPVADAAFSANTLSTEFAWLGVLAYTFQIYFDFSGYSDMAIGLSKMFGFNILENFNYPYISRSITEFWRRWHISLGTWFRDYLYIPLGGSRVKSKWRLVFNLFIVWLLTGLWHGANWTFILWGLMYFLFIALEKLTGLDKFFINNKVTSVLGFSYTILLVMIGWVLFRAESVSAAVEYITYLFGRGYGNDVSTAGFWLRENVVFYITAAIFSTPIAKWASNKATHSRTMQVAYTALMVVLFFITISYVVMGSYSPFIYFNF